jgi:hypothetical protein
MISIYHRLASPTQTPLVAMKQMEIQEIWGNTPRNGFAPKVEAYVGCLPVGADGIEFTTEVLPDSGCPPMRANWSGNRNGVKLEDDFAKISVTITHCTQI